MFLALREVGRAKARFGLLIAAIALLVFLILTQQALQTGLITSFIGAIERQSAPVLVYSVDGERTLQGSIITPDLEAGIARVPGVAESGRIGQGTFTVSIDGRPQSDAALIGYEHADLGAPQPLSAGRLPNAPGEAVGTDGDFRLGQTGHRARQRGAAEADRSSALPAMPRSRSRRRSRSAGRTTWPRRRPPTPMPQPSCRT